MAKLSRSQSARRPGEGGSWSGSNGKSADRAEAARSNDTRPPSDGRYEGSAQSPKHRPRPAALGSPNLRQDRAPGSSPGTSGYTENRLYVPRTVLRAKSARDVAGRDSRYGHSSAGSGNTPPYAEPVTTAGQRTPPHRSRSALPVKEDGRDLSQSRNDFSLGPSRSQVDMPSASMSGGRTPPSLVRNSTPPPSMARAGTPPPSMARDRTPTNRDRTPPPPMGRERAQPPSLRRDGTPPRSLQREDVSSVNGASVASRSRSFQAAAPHAARQSRDPGDVWFNNSISHSAARARERDAHPMDKSVDSRSNANYSTFSRQQRDASYHTQDGRTRSSRHVSQSPKHSSIWEQEGYAGKRVAGRRAAGKRIFIGAPHTADTPGMSKIVCGSDDLDFYREEQEKEAGSCGNMFDGLAGYTDQDNDVGDGSRTGKRPLHGAPHVADTADIQKIVCGSSKLAKYKEAHEKNFSHLADMFDGHAGYSAQDEDSNGKATGKKSLRGAPHVQDTPLTGILVGSNKLGEHKRLHDEKNGGKQLERMLDGRAGLSLQDDDVSNDPLARKTGTRSFAGAPHVQDTADMFDLVCGSQALKAAHERHGHHMAQSNMFDGAAGINLQDEDIYGPKASGKQKPPSNAAASMSTVREEAFDCAFQPEDRSADRFRRRKLQTLFISHGQGPMPLLTDSRQPSIRCLTNLPAKLGLDKDSVRCILVISAHWETHGRLEVTSQRTKKQGLLYDYRGAPPEAYELHRQCHPPGDPEVTSWVTDMLRAVGKDARHNSCRDLDHGVFVPLLLMNGLANLPVVQLSLPALHGQKGADMAQFCLEVGQALEPLRSRGVLILGSGMSTHSNAKPSRIERWTDELIGLCCEASPQERYDGLRTWTSSLPHAREVHGREEHLLPLFIAAGAALRDRGEVVGDFRSETGLAMTHFVFG